MEEFKCIKCGKSFEADPKKDLLCCPECGNMDFSKVILRPGFKISGFELKKKIGSGAMGEVWLADQISMGREVAVKILSSAYSSSLSGAVNRFQTEVKNSAKLFHANIVTAFDAGFDAGFYYLVSAYVEGRDLEKILADVGVFDETEVLFIAYYISDALKYAWEEFRLFHRDIKPSNIIINKKGLPILLDMGLSKCVAEDPALTNDSQLVGTPYYMSPEQAKGEKNIDFRADIYALGGTLYHLLTGKVPFSGENTVGIITKHVTEPLVPPKKYNSKITEETNHLIQKMMEKDPKGRFQNWEEVINEINKILEELKDKGQEKKTEASSVISPEEQASVIQEKTRKIEKKISKAKQSNKANSFGKGLKFLLKLIGVAVIAVVLVYFALSLYQYYFKEMIYAYKEETLVGYLNTKLNILLTTLINIIQGTIYGRKVHLGITSTVNIRILGVELLFVLLTLFSAFWSISKAAKDNRSKFWNFIGGLFIPVFYPVFLYPAFKSSTTVQPAEEKELSEAKIRKYFIKLAKKNKGGISEKYYFELMDDSSIYAEKIIGVKKNIIVILIRSKIGDTKTINLPYFRIKNFKEI